MEKQPYKAKLMLITAMSIFGTIGIFVRYIPLPSSVIALSRALIGTVFLLAFLKIKHNSINRDAVVRNFKLLLISGILLGLNWILLFEAYNYTTVAIATLCYYMAPIIIIIISPLVFGEKLTKKKIICVLFALVGIVLVSGVIHSSTGDFSLMGLAFGMGAAAVYASIIIVNKKINNITSYDTTVIQLGVAALLLIPYCLVTSAKNSFSFESVTIVLLLIIGIVHTGIAYMLYFGSMQHLKSQTIAIYSYIDPILAVMLSAFLLRENMDIFSVIGAIFILTSTFIGGQDKK